MTFDHFTESSFTNFTKFYGVSPTKSGEVSISIFWNSGYFMIFSMLGLSVRGGAKKP